MEKRLPGSMRTRETLSELIEGRLSAPDARSELVRLATRLITEETLGAESRDALGRDYYERGGGPRCGYRNGNRSRRMKTAEGALEYTAPQIADRSRRRKKAAWERKQSRTVTDPLKKPLTRCVGKNRALMLDSCDTLHWE